MKKSQLAGLAIAVAIVVAGKQYFRSATADDLRWLLAPTAKCVSVLTRSHFTHEVGLGYVTLWVLSTENLSRAADEADSSLQRHARHRLSRQANQGWQCAAHRGDHALCAVP